jgi:hypothetical protein
LILNLFACIPDIIANNQELITSTKQIEGLEAKMKHCNQSIDSLHLKLKSLDTQLKESATKNDVGAK